MVSPSKFVNETLKAKNYKEWLKQEDIANIAKLYYGWHGENDNVLFEVIGFYDQLKIQLQRSLPELQNKNKQSLIYILNLNNNHWVTLVMTYYNQQLYAYHIDSLGNSITKDYVSLLDQKNINIKSFSINQQSDEYNCAIFALENARIINESILSSETDSLEQKLRKMQLSTQELEGKRQEFANLLQRNNTSLSDNDQLDDQIDISCDELDDESEEDYVINTIVSHLKENPKKELRSVGNFEIGTVVENSLLGAVAQGLNKLRNENIIEHNCEFSVELLQGSFVNKNYSESSNLIESYDYKKICDEYNVDLHIIQSIIIKSK